MSSSRKILPYLIFIRFCEFASCATFVEAKVGRIQGYEEDGLSVFRGIPYGKVDADNPFRAATRYPDFDSTFNATAVVVCPQANNSIPIGTIHCLTLDIFRSKDATPNDTLPVMVYVQGGMFKRKLDCKSYSAKFLVRYGVIVVLVNFRLGPYGFLCWNSSEYSNQGLRDVALSLEWVKNNINSFGGDNKNVLLFGGSTGAAIVELLLFFNKDNLFNKVILQSGSAVSPKVMGGYDDGLISRITSTLGYDGPDDVENIIEFLSKVEVRRVIEVTENETFSPCIDGVLVKDKAEINKQRDVKVMLGTTDKEMLLFIDLNNDTFFENYDYKTEVIKGFRNATDKMVDFAKEFYQDGDVVENVLDFGADFWFNYPVDRCLEFYADNNITVYRFLFTYVGNRNNLKVIKNSMYVGATHGDELRYLFGTRELQGDIAEDDQLMIDRITAMWTNFAKYGNPTPTVSELLPVEWLPVSSGSKPYLLMDSSLELRYRPYQQRMAYWHLFYDHYKEFIRSIDISPTSN